MHWKILDWKAYRKHTQTFELTNINREIYEDALIKKVYPYIYTNIHIICAYVDKLNNIYN